MLRRQEFVAKQESKAQIERLQQYGQKQYKEYTAFDPEWIELSNTTYANRKKFEKETLPSVSDELIDKVINFIKENRDEQIITLLKRSNFDYESLIASEVDEQIRTRAFLEAVLKAQSYDESVEQNKNRAIDFSGFENDTDIPDVKEFIYRIFGTELLQKCLISKVKYVSEKVNVRIKGTDYILPVDVYAEWKRQMPEVESRRFRAESFTSLNTDPNFSKKFISTPIRFYSFYGVETESLDYLEHVPARERMRQYKLGTVAHEVAHHVYAYLMDADKRKEFKNLVGRSSAITEYANFYAGHELKYEEFFTEAIRFVMEMILI